VYSIIFLNKKTNTACLIVVSVNHLCKSIFNIF